MIYQVHFQKPLVDDLEINSGELITEQAGYIPPKKQIEDMINAGRRLSDSRGQYDWQDGNVDEEADDPTRRSNYDMADAFQDKLAANNRLKASQTAQEASQATLLAQREATNADLKEKPQEASKGV